MEPRTAVLCKQNIVALVLATVHCCITFFTDPHVFKAPAVEHLFNYLVCKLILFVFLFFIYRALIFRSPATLEILKYSALYLVPLAAVMVFKLPQGFLSNDETLIFAEAGNLADYTWFYYLTTYYYIVTMMLIPSWLGPVLVKVAIQLLVCGYIVFRVRHYLDKRYGYFMYLAFLIPPVLAYTTSAHRIPVYFLLYAFMVFSLLMDRLEQRPVSRPKLLWLLILGAVLTQWRTEGIYLAALLPILLLLTYPALRNKKKAAAIVLVYIFIQYLVQIPQNGVLPMRMGDKAENRMGPFYAYTITNMFRNGLDPGKNREAIELVGRYLDIDTIEAINRDLGDINYEDVLILYYPGYTGLKEGAGDEDYRAYVEGCRSIFVNNPGVFLKTRIGAFDYAATPYSIAWKEGGVRGFALFLVSVVKTIAYNVYAPFVLLMIGLVYALVRRRWWTFFLGGGLMCHWFIVFILAPASYFKYYFPLYFTVYALAVFVVDGLLYRHFRKEEKELLP